MYSKHQFDCLKQLGISLIAPASFVNDAKKDTSGASSESTLEQLQSVSRQAEMHTAEQPVASVSIPESLLTDLKVLFPSFSQTGNRVKLADNFSWLIEDKTTRIIATRTQVISPAYHQLNAQQKRQFWLALQEQVTQYS